MDALYNRQSAQAIVRREKAKDVKALKDLSGKGARGGPVMRRISTVSSVLLALLLAASLAGCGARKTSGKKESIYDAAPLKKVTVGDIDIAYKEMGKGETLVMIPAFAMTMDVWDPDFLTYLAASHRVIVCDNRGMGYTTAGKKEFTIDQFADDTAGFIDKLGLKKTDVLGWSIGGDIVLSLVVYHPDKVRNLISYAGDCGGPQAVQPPPYSETLQSVQGFRAPGKNLLAALFPPEYMQANPLFAKDFPFPSEPIKPVSILRQLKAYDEWPGVYDELPRIRKPVLAATGTEDVSTPPENATILAERIPGCELARFEGAGHGLQYQYPKEFAATILAFLKKHGGQKSGKT
jgi:pimeloyl-ACP methyl ester carboxylesterase